MCVRSGSDVGEAVGSIVKIGESVGFVVGEELSVRGVHLKI